MFLGAVVGGTLALLLLKTLDFVPAAVASAIALTSLLSALTELSNPRLWWLCVGAVAGIIIGMAVVMEQALTGSEDILLNTGVRWGIVGILGLGGFVSGVLLSRREHPPGVPSLTKLISHLTSLTVSVFAVVITIRYLIDGLEAARTLSSRLTTTTTIVATALIVPGSLGFLLTERQTHS